MVIKGIKNWKDIYTQQTVKNDSINKYNYLQSFFHLKLFFLQGNVKMIHYRWLPHHRNIRHPFWYFEKVPENYYFLGSFWKLVKGGIILRHHRIDYKNDFLCVLIRSSTSWAVVFTVTASTARGRLCTPSNMFFISWFALSMSYTSSRSFASSVITRSISFITFRFIYNW